MFTFKEDARVIKVDWKSGANSVYYPNSAANTRTVGAEIAFIIQKLIRDHAYTEPWCIGFSLGAHACGFAGNTITLSRITGIVNTISLKKVVRMQPHLSYLGFIAI